MTVWALTRRKVSRWLPVLGFATFAGLSLVVLELDYRRGVAVLEETVVAVDNLTRARLAVADAALAWESQQGGNPTSAPGVQLLRLDEAVGALGDLLTGQSTLVSFQGGQVLDESQQRPLVQTYRDRVSEVRAALQGGGAPGDPVAQRIRLRGLSDAAADLERAVYRAVEDRLEAKRRRHVVLLGAWGGFLALSLIGLTALRAAGARARAGRLRADRLRGAAERRYAALERVAAVGILRVDGSGIVREATPWWGRALGRQEGECLGKAWWAVSTDEGQERGAAAWRDGVATGMAFVQDVRITNAEGKERWLAGRWQPDAPGSPEGGGWVGAFLDITEQRLLEDQVHQAQKLEAVGRLTGGLAHDFNNLLSVVLTNTHLLLMDADTLGEEDREILTDIDRAAKSGRDLVKRLMTFSRRGDLNVAPLELSTTVQEAAALARRLLPPGYELEVLASEAGPSVQADPRAVEQIILNLVANARDAMEHGGRILITVDAVLADAEFRGERPWVQPGRYGRVTVADEGAGMDAATLEQIFEPLFTTKSEGKGTGLGLSTVHGLMRQQQGHVRVYSEPGVGSTFRLYFPESPQGVRTVPVGGEETTDAGASTSPRALTILLVDDDDALRRTSQRMLVRLGYRVLEAADGAEALRVLDGPVAPDLILSDLSMSGMDGLELFRRVEERGDGRAFVFTSGRLQEDLEGRAVLPPGAHFLPKPWGAEQFVTLMDELGLRAG